MIATESHHVTAHPVVGDRFGRLLVLAVINKDRCGQKFLCRCDCGKDRSVYSHNIRSGKTKSCGCLHRETTRLRSTVHGAKRNGIKTPEYGTWQAMLSRCINQNDGSFPDYGGRGIQVCKRWIESFQNFLDDVGLRPTGKTLDRINNDGNYEPNNCHWATKKQQARNTRTNRWIEFNGQKKVLAQWADDLEIAPNVLVQRLKRGWPIERALTESAKRKHI